MLYAAASLPFTPSGWIAPAVSAAAGVACLVGFIATWVFGDQSTPRLSLVELLGAITGVSTAAFAQPVRKLIARADWYLSDWSMHWTGVALVGVILAIPVAYVVVKVVVKKIIDNRVMWAAATLPIIVPFIPGLTGGIASFLVYLPANLVGWIAAKLFGLF